VWQISTAQKIRASLPVLARLIWAEDDAEIVQSAVTALSYISDGGMDRIQALIDAGVCRRLCDLLVKYALALASGVEVAFMAPARSPGSRRFAERPDSVHAWLVMFESI
jgi:hypothetical protein